MGALEFSGRGWIVVERERGFSCGKFASGTYKSRRTREGVGGGGDRQHGGCENTDGILVLGKPRRLVEIDVAEFLSDY